jgi:hypothetical protein
MMTIDPHDPASATGVTGRAAPEVGTAMAEPAGRVARI